MENVNLKKWSIAIIIYLCMTVLSVGYISQLLGVSYEIVILFTFCVFFPIFEFAWSIFLLGKYARDETRETSVKGTNKATQTGQKLAVTFFANSATKAPSSFCRWWRR
ncbi:hypothetical protein [Lacimicrobium alkaliphilum]|uniref:hypothetical protein n=1 Tax=Lacimicrobium alkaliphilum TaxID=1526571 RepID=UPI000BFEB977|nr:hypothetical protein [Lacimicrobium alkaliphilum]